jgi:hypothetical protein
VSLKINIVAAFVALTTLAAPAFASARFPNAIPQTEPPRHQEARHLNLKSRPDTFALASALSDARIRQTSGAQTLIARSPNGRNLGTDPDPAIRRELRRDWFRGC